MAETILSAIVDPAKKRRKFSGFQGKKTRNPEDGFGFFEMHSQARDRANPARPDSTFNSRAAENRLKETEADKKKQLKKKP